MDADVLVDDTHALMTQAALDRLLDYSCSLPTGTTIGKRWKRAFPSKRESWLMGEYTNEPAPPGEIAIRWREILLVKES